jgi:hypothetical protein
VAFQVATMIRREKGLEQKKSLKLGRWAAAAGQAGPERPEEGAA